MFCKSFILHVTTVLRPYWPGNYLAALTSWRRHWVWWEADVPRIACSRSWDEDRSDEGTLLVIGRRRRCRQPAGCVFGTMSQPDAQYRQHGGRMIGGVGGPTAVLWSMCRRISTTRVAARPDGPPTKSQNNIGVLQGVSSGDVQNAVFTKRLTTAEKCNSVRRDLKGISTTAALRCASLRCDSQR